MAEDVERRGGDDRDRRAPTRSGKGLLTGLVISEVNQQKVTTVAEVTEKVSAAKEAGRPAVLFKVTDPAGASRFIAVKLGSPSGRSRLPGSPAGRAGR